jgi:hypothetical protein
MLVSFSVGTLARFMARALASAKVSHVNFFNFDVLSGVSFTFFFFPRFSSDVASV